MRTLLVNSHISEDLPSASEDALPPLGYGYIATELVKSGIEVEFLDAYLKNLDSTAVISAVNNSAADYYLINIFSSNFTRVVNIINESTRDKKWLVGGTPAKFLLNKLKECVKNHDVHVVIGEAEYYMPFILRNGIPTGFSSYVIDKANEYFPRDLITIPDRTLFSNNFKKYDEGKITEAAIITSRGCPYDCAFCCAARSINTESSVRNVSLETIEKDINSIENLGQQFNCIRILDDLFIKNEQSIANAEFLFKNSRNKWRSMAHIDILSKFSRDSFSKLFNSGCLELFVGIESGSDKTLRKINKKTNPQKTTQTIKIILESGISVKGYFILGFPDETLEDATETERMAHELSIFSQDSIGKFRPSVFKFRPYDGTILYDELASSGRVASNITTDTELTKSGKRDSYDLTSGNYSDIDSSELNNIIDRIRNGTNKQDKEVTDTAV